MSIVSLLCPQISLAASGMVDGELGEGISSYMTVVTFIVTKEHFMIAVAKGKLKAHMLEYFRRVEETGEELVVTDNHMPVLKVIPFRRKLSPEEAFGDLRGKVKYNSDIREPETGEWLEK